MLAMANEEMEADCGSGALLIMAANKKQLLWGSSRNHQAEKAFSLLEKY